MGCGRTGTVALEWGLDPSASRPGDCGCGGEPCPCGCSEGTSVPEFGLQQGGGVAVMVDDPCKTARELYEQQNPGKVVECRPDTYGGTSDGPVVITFDDDQSGSRAAGDGSPVDMGGCLCWVVGEVDDQPREPVYPPDLRAPILLDPEFPELPAPRKPEERLPPIEPWDPKLKDVVKECMKDQSLTQIPADAQETQDKGCAQSWNELLEAREAAIAAGQDPPSLGGGPCAIRYQVRWNNELQECERMWVVCGSCALRDELPPIDWTPPVRQVEARR